MNKLASMIYLDCLGLLKIPFYIISSDDENKVFLKSIYSGGQWAIRSAEKPSNEEEKEMGLPWSTANSLDELVKNIAEVRARANGLIIIIHKQRQFRKVGGMRISPDYIEIEGFKGSDDVSALVDTENGRISPEAVYTFSPGMLRYNVEGKKNFFTPDELRQLRDAEKIIEGNISPRAGVINMQFAVNNMGEVDFFDIYGLQP